MSPRRFIRKRISPIINIMNIHMTKNRSNTPLKPKLMAIIMNTITTMGIITTATISMDIIIIIITTVATTIIITTTLPQAQSSFANSCFSEPHIVDPHSSRWFPSQSLEAAAGIHTEQQITAIKDPEAPGAQQTQLHHRSCKNLADR